MRAPFAFKAAAGALLVLLCGSCSFEIAVKAVFIDGRLAFVADGEPASLCLSHFAVAGEAGEVAWEVDGLPGPEGERCDPGFPLFYGRLPAGAKEIVPARPLVPRNLYVIEGRGGDLYVGAFVLFRGGRRLRVENLDPNSPTATAVRGNGSRP